MGPTRRAGDASMLQTCRYQVLHKFAHLLLAATACLCSLSCCMHGRSKRADDAFSMQTCCLLPVLAHSVLYC